jgi:hypothetical protein
MERVIVSPGQELYEKLCQEIHAAGGWVTSEPGADTLRFEIPERSELPERLRAAGWRPLHMRRGTRIVPGASSETVFFHSAAKSFQCRNDSFLAVNVYELNLKVTSQKPRRLRSSTIC